MTAHVTRAPLQLIQNPHIMTDAQRNGRRHSSRLADKEDAPLSNGYEPVKASQKAPSGATRAMKSTKAGAKRKNAYEEEEDGFSFTRTKSKKQKPEPAQPAIAEESIAPPTQRHAELAPIAQKKSKQRFEDSPVTGIAEQKPIATKTRRSTRTSGGSQEDADPPPLAVKKRRKGRDSDEQPRASGRTKNTQHDDGDQGQPREDSQKGEQDQTHPVEITFDATKIALPFADTPIIRRNQEMRKGIASGHGKRRSSLGMRGRRASSLIDTGKSNALPHDSVETADFYKHIESEGLPEPRRMKQLLTWCGTRALGEKPPSVKGEDQHAALAAREIQSQLLKDFSTKSSLSDWFDRMEEPAKPSPPKANPKNLANQARIVELEEQLARLKTERESWTSLLSPKSSYQQSASLSLPPIPTPSNPPDPSAIASSLLPPDQQSILESLLPPSSSAPTNPTTSSALASTSLRDRTSRRLHTLTKDLEFTIDAFATNVHALQSYKDVAGRLANGALADCAEVLEERDRQSTIRAAGEGHDGEPPVAGGEMRTVLRGLSRVIDD